MLTKRIIPCLDVHHGRTVKGVSFLDLRDAGDPVELARRYVEEGADELVFLDITATVEQRRVFATLVRRVAQELNIPFTVGGGVSSVSEVSALLAAGADKISINSAAVRNPGLISELAEEFGSQCIVVAIDTQWQDSVWRVVTHGGRKPTERLTIDWAREVCDRGAGEILLTSIDHDGTKGGFACELTRQISQSVSVPVIASGGAGSMDHFVEVLRDGRADAALAASVFHFGEIRIGALKQYLKACHLPVRV